MNRNLIFAFLLLAALAMVNAVPHQLLKRGKDLYESCPENPESSYIYANLKPFPPVSNQSTDYTVEGVMMKYSFTPYKTEVIIVYIDSNNNVISTYTKVLEMYYANAAPFSVDVSDVPTPQLPSAYAIVVIIADKTDDPDNPDIHACVYGTFG